MQCPPPPKWHHASVFPNLTSWEYGQVLNITCEPGHWISKYVYDTAITCSAYGTWQSSHPENQCQCKLIGYSWDCERVHIIMLYDYQLPSPQLESSAAPLPQRKNFLYLLFTDIVDGVTLMLLATLSYRLKL